jgi:hypothetical protein
VVQLDQEPPLRISDAAAARHLTMAPLSPGSHRLTVYAARPWGEVVKAPLASRQIRLNRVAANHQQVPAPGSPQLLAALGGPGATQEPVLIDWLLLDAPLQHLKDDDGRWRLRVSVNGDSFLVDRQTPLWLKGFHGGSNAVQLELLDGRGEPLNPPFNSLVEEVVIQPGAGAAWLQSSLSPLEQAQLLGEAPLAPGPEANAKPAPLKKSAEQGSNQVTESPAALPLEETKGSPTKGESLVEAQPLPVAQKPSRAPAPIDDPGAQTNSSNPSELPARIDDVVDPAPPQVGADGAGGQPALGVLATPGIDQSAEPQDGLKDPEPTLSPAASLAPAPEKPAPKKSETLAKDDAQTAEGKDQSGADQALPAPDGPEVEDGAPLPMASPIPVSPAPAPEAGPEEPGPEEPGPELAPAASATEPRLPGASAASATAPSQERLSPSTSLSGRARDQVAADGSLLKPRPEGPLARLRQRFQP